MKKLIILAALPLTLSLAACSSGSVYGSGYSSNNNSGYGSSNNEGYSQSSMPKTHAPESISAHQTHLGTVWATKDGMTLYTFTKDQANLSNCTAACAKIWPPLHASKGAKDVGQFHVIEREDGTYQWTLHSKPLYTFIKDTKAGDITGQGVKNIWFVARADDVPTLTYQANGQNVLTDAEQMSLYVFDKDSIGVSKCNDGCATAWPPLSAQKNAHATGPYSILKRDDGTWQWALNGKPLYTRLTDEQPGDTTGDGAGGVWHLAINP